MTNGFEKSILYLRISDKSQNGLGSQEHRGRMYSDAHGLEVETVFFDDMTGRGHFIQRKGIVDLLQYLEEHPESNYVVVFDDIKRFARDTLSYLMLRQMLKEHGAKAVCLNYTFDDSPEGVYNETMTAAAGQLEAEQNQRQVIQKQRARLEQGFWTFAIGKGYRFEEAEEGGKVLVRDEPIASYIVEAQEGFASGRFQTKAEMGRFLAQFPEFSKTKKGDVHADWLDRILTRSIYAGYIEYEPWGITLRKGQHEPLISYETFLRIQERLEQGAYAPTRKNINMDFPLRGFVACTCGTALTACWSKGRNTRYPYYLCQTKGCEHKGKSIRREVVETEFEKLLMTLVPPKGLMTVFGKMLKEQWKHRAEHVNFQSQSLHAELAKIEAEIERLLDGVVSASDPKVIGAFERKIKRHEQEKVLINEKLEQSGRPVKGFDGAIWASS